MAYLGFDATAAAPAETTTTPIYPVELCAIPQWVAWKLGDTNPETRRQRKIPLNLNATPGQKNFASTTNQDHHVAFEVATAAAQRGKFGTKGIGFVFTDDDPYCFIDLDDCLAPDGSLTKDAATVAELMAGTYGEVSQSGSGLHFICRAKLANKVATGAIDIYPHSQYCALTGKVYGGFNPIVDKQAEVEQLVALLRSGSVANPPPSESRSSLGDNELLSMASNAKNGALFDSLWRGDTSGHGNDHSRADNALLMLLLYWTNGDTGAVDRLFRQSGLMRDKWDEKHYADGRTYGAGSIDNALKKWDGVGFSGGNGGDLEHGRQIAAALLRSRSLGGGREPGADDEPHQEEPAANDPQPEPAQPAKRNPDAPQYLSFADLAAMQFPEPSWILPDILPDAGLYLLSGKPKCGKSWLALSLALSVATGGYCLGRTVEQGRVMYLALEDTPRRFMQRMHKIQPDCLINPRVKEALDNGMFTPTFPKLGRGFEAAIEEAITGAGVRLLIIDTLAKIRPIGGGNANRYDADYGAVGALKDIADRHGICVLVLHHTRKAEADDVHDTVSGTNGIAGAADGSLVLLRQRGGDGSATLAVTGRDLPEAEFGLRFKDGFWDFVGNAEEVKASTEQNAIFNALKGYGGDGATVKMLCATLREEGFGKEQTVRYHLRRMVDAGRVRVRNTKPAPHYAICDGSATPPEGEEQAFTGGGGDPTEPPEMVDTLDRVNTLDTLDTLDTPPQEVGIHPINPPTEPPETDPPIKGIKGINLNLDTPETRLVSSDSPPPIKGIKGINQNSVNPLERRIIEVLDGQPGGMDLATLAKVATGKAGEALFKKTVDGLLLRGAIGRRGDRYISGNPPPSESKHWGVVG